MIRFNMRMFSAPTIMSLIVFAATSLGNAQKIDAKIDVAVVLPVGDSDAMKDALYTLPRNHFEMGEQKAKVALLGAQESIYGNTILQELTGNETAFTSFPEEWTHVPDSEGSDYHRAFAAIRENVFEFSDEKRSKAVIVFLPFFDLFDRPEMSSSAAQEAKSLREKGVPLYVIFNQDWKSEKLREHAENWAGNQTDTIGIPGHDFYRKMVDAISEIKPLILRDLCFWTTACHYENAQRQACESEAWRPSTKPNYFDDSGAQCLMVKPNDTRTCTLDDCVKECDERWEWEGPTPDCNKTCGAVVKRKVGTPPEKLENCPAEFKCPPCPTMASTTTVTTTISRTATMTDSTTTGGTTSMTTTAAASTDIEPKGLADIEPKGLGDASITGPAAERETEQWLIPVIVVVVVVVLLIVAGIALLIVVRKKRKRRKKLAVGSSLKPNAKGEVAVDVKQAEAEMSMVADMSIVGKTTMVSSKSKDNSVMSVSNQPNGNSMWKKRLRSKKK